MDGSGAGIRRTSSRLLTGRSCRAWASGKLTDLKPVDIERWYGDLVKAGGLAPSTAKERVIMLGQICEFAVRHGWLKVSPIPEARKLLRGIPKTPIRTFKPEQVLALIRAAEVRRKGQHARTQPAMQCFLHLAAFCGLRYGEIAGLTLPRVDLARSVIEVRHSLTPWDELKGPKTISGNRNVHMPPHLTEMLRAWIADEYVDNPRQLIFRTLVSRSDKGPGGFIHPGSFRVSYWYPLLEAAGLMAGANGDNYHFHALRHFSAGWMIANGMPGDGYRPSARPQEIRHDPASLRPSDGRGGRPGDHRRPDGKSALSGPRLKPGRCPALRKACAWRAKSLKSKAV